MARNYEEQGPAIFSADGNSVCFCILGIVTYIKERGKNYWWRLIYLFGGLYLLFDLFAIATGMEFWQRLLDKMFDTQGRYWNVIWGFFIFLGGSVFALGIILLFRRKKI